MSDEGRNVVVPMGAPDPRRYNNGERCTVTFNGPVRVRALDRERATEFAQELVWLYAKTNMHEDITEEFGKAAANAEAYLRGPL